MSFGGKKKIRRKKSSKCVCQSAKSISDWECSISVLYFALLQCKNFILERGPFNSKFQINLIYHFALVEIILCSIIFGINLSLTLQKFNEMSQIFSKTFKKAVKWEPAATMPYFDIRNAKFSIKFAMCQI